MTAEEFAMPNEVKLLSCPFCGNHGVGPAFVCESGRWDIWQVECGFCDISIESPSGFNDEAAKQAAIAAWNTRPTTLVTDEVVDLRALLKRVTDVADNLAGELSDPGTEALSAIYCAHAALASMPTVVTGER